MLRARTKKMKENKNKKKENGQYFTIKNPFKLKIFKRWFKYVYHNEVILEPFAGANNIVALVNEVCPKTKFKSFDIDTSFKNVYPKVKVVKRDTLTNFPKGYNTVITNPPYLAKNSATRNKLYYPNTNYDDIYKYSLEIMLNNVDNVAAIIPESFVTSGLFIDRLYAVSSLTTKMFNDTECPVCLALFVKEKENLEIEENNFLLYRMDEYIGEYNSILKKINKYLSNENIIEWKFNDVNGNIGIKCVDNTKEPTIYFLEGEEVEKSRIKVSSRALTRVSGLPKNIKTKNFINKCNNLINEYRNKTKDIFLTSFKGLRADNCYRRRLDFKTARQIMNKALEAM